MTSGKESSQGQNSDSKDDFTHDLTGIGDNLDLIIDARDITEAVAEENNYVKDGLAEAEQQSYELNRVKEELEQAKAENDRYKDDTVQRRKLALWTKWVVSVWLGLVLFILMLNNLEFKLPNSVLITLLGTTTLNVLGLPLIVLKGYFPGSKKRNGKD